METKAKIGLFFGGKSVEHEVSLRSIRSIFDALDRSKYEPILIAVSKEGKLFFAKAMSYFEKAVAVDDVLEFLDPLSTDKIRDLDLSCIFSTMHGGFGENGCFQGLFEILNIPYVGPGVLGSSIAMDKDVTKRLLLQAGIHVTPFVCAKKDTVSTELLSSQQFPCFIKASNLGSSVGVYKCYSLEEAQKAAESVFELDHKVLIEKAIKGREIEVAVLGLETKLASLSGEVIPTHDFYSYEAKYLDDSGAILEIPAKNIDHEYFQKLAIKVCEVLEIESMARVDFFVLESGQYYVNEVNTLPGFTSISMYPKLFEASGISYCHLITKLIEDAIWRFNKNSKVQKTLYANL
jgi:D-alanine-D-alanine ligase